MKSNGICLQTFATTTNIEIAPPDFPRQKQHNFVSAAHWENPVTKLHRDTYKHVIKSTQDLTELLNEFPMSPVFHSVLLVCTE